MIVIEHSQKKIECFSDFQEFLIINILKLRTVNFIILLEILSTS